MAGKAIMKETDRYRRIVCIGECIFFTLVALGGEIIQAKALERFYSGYSFSISILPLFILMFRWGRVSAYSPVVLGLFATLLVPHAEIRSYIINGAGYAGYSLALLLFLRPGRERVRENPVWALLFVVSGYGGMILFRSIVLSMFEGDFPANLVFISANETLGFIAVAALFVLMRGHKDLLVNMRDVLAGENQ